MAQQSESPAEAQVAQKKLTSLLQKHNLTLEDLVEEKLTRVYFRAKSKLEKELLFQVFYKVFNEDFHYFKRGRQFGVNVTPLQAAEIKVLYSHYLKLWREEVDRLQIAFYSKHQLHSDKPSNKPSTLSEEEIYRIRMMMEGLQVSPDPRHRHLGTGTPDDLIT